MQNCVMISHWDEYESKITFWWSLNCDENIFSEMVLWEFAEVPSFERDMRPRSHLVNASDAV